MGRPLPADLATVQSDEKDVILGMPGPWAEDNYETSDYYTTKIGGVPDWPMPAEEVSCDLLKCGLCGGDLGLVAQVYAPLAVSGAKIDDRTIYIFGCPSSSCGISPLSWRSLRVQKEIDVAPVSSRASVRDVRSSIEASSSSIGELTGDDSCEGGERIIGRSEEQHEESGNDWWDDDSWGPVVPRGDESLLAMEELETALLEAGYAAAAARLGTQNSDIQEEIISVQDDAGTSGIESTEPGLPVMPCFYIYSQSESHPSRGSRAVSALQTSELLEERGGMDGNTDRGDEAWEGEEYEHDRALSADRTYLKFKKRLDCYPEQCFRYCFGGRPLWANKDRGEPGVCMLCGGPRVYELQLMPPLLYYLQQACKDLPPISYSPNDWEWLTLIVYTCAQSCTQGQSNHREDANGEQKQWVVIEESTILQYET